ncbi:LAO/AO transport system kinase [Evansella vedderi]|uniref:LAO/AO transport system kinase n=1 Tax=Evansella vedderi TaxID=38282 RepID=A0ABU0A1M6_9BACI|nr:methylmalonyl Co-A mutase-associated GTPase MeaB [Evansella vedderi]MDQ0257383.1 LAO/AO transport system kinase [Evansella vedderi]
MVEEMASRILNGEQRAIGKAISLIEDRKPEHRDLMSRLYPHAGKGQIVGITGSPGAGKSSLVNGLVKEWRNQGRSVAIIAVDPTSPFSGGALLGDRIRMRDLEEDDHIFIRSMGTRGSLGGLSEACQDVVRLMDAAGFDLVVVETVGVGQSELDIMKTADTVALVLYPSGGDLIQAFKAGIMEIADLFVINKADLPGVEQLKGELQDLLHITSEGRKWEPPILQTISTEKKGMAAVVTGIRDHYDYLVSTGKRLERRLSQKELEVMRRLHERFTEEVRPIVEKALEMNASDPYERLLEIDPYGLAEVIFCQWRKGNTEERGEG